MLTKRDHLKEVEDAIEEVEDVVGVQDADSLGFTCVPSCWTGFKLVINNFDKNFHLSFQCCDKRTESMQIISETSCTWILHDQVLHLR